MKNQKKIKLEEFEEYRESTINFIIYLSKGKLTRYTAEDIFQDAFFLFEKNFNTIENISIKNYILTICKNEYFQSFFNNRHKSKYIDKQINDKLIDDFSKVEKYYNLSYYQNDNLDYEYYLNLIPDSYTANNGSKRKTNGRKLFIDYLNGYSNKEIAYRNNIDYYSVGTMLSRIRNRFIKKVDPKFVKENKRFKSKSIRYRKYERKKI